MQQRLSKGELDEFFDALENEDLLGDPEVELLDALRKYGFAATLHSSFAACKSLISERSAIVSIFACGFSMGRAYEERHQVANELERLLQREPK